MTMQPVESSNIKAIGHDGLSSTLRVEFKSGHSYNYQNVSAEQHAAFMAAPSHGKHFHQHFRGNLIHQVSRQQQ